MNSMNYKFSPSYISKTFDLILTDVETYALEPGQVVGPLLREYQVIRLCVAGTGVISINGLKRFIRPGDGYVCMTGDVVMETADGDTPWLLCSLIIIGIKSEAHLKSVGVTHANCHNPPIITPALFELAKKLSGENIAYRPTSTPEEELTCISKGYELFAMLTREYRRSSPEVRTASIQERYINEAVAYMELHYDSSLSIRDIASHLGLNTCYFQRVFREHTGVTPWEYIIRMRVSRACDLFDSPNATNDSVANSIGWEPSVLYRNFKRITGTTPSEYRKKINKARGRHKNRES